MRKLLQRLSETVRPSAWKPPLMLMTALLSLLSLGTFAQTTLLSGTSSEGSFEGASLSADGWTAVQSATNYWVNGTALASHGSKSAFITNDGTTNGYNNASTQANHIYKDFTAPVGENIITLTFDLKGNPVDAGFDRFRVYVAPVTVTPVAGTEATAGATQVFSFDGNLATFTGQTAGFSTTTLGSQSFRVIFTWRNDGSVGVNPPYAVDKVNITSGAPSTFTATAQGGLWSNGNTWVGGIAPVNAVGNSIVIPAGSVVTVDQVISYADYTINGTLYWNGTANAMSASGNVTIGATGRFLPYTTAGSGVTVHCLGNFTNNGYANLYLSTMNFTGTGSQTFGGTGTYQGNGVKPTISAISRNNTGTVNVGFACNVGSLNPINGTITGANNIELDFTKRQIWAEPTFTGTLSQAVITNMGAGYSVAPVVGPASAQLWVASQAVTTSAIRIANGQVYVCSVAGTTDAAVAPSHTSGTATDGTATWLWVGAAGSVGNAMTITALTAGTQYFYGNNLYTCTVAGTPSAAAPPTHTSGIAVSGTATFQYVGSAAKISLNYDATNQVVRSANITTAGSGYVGNPSAVILASAAPTTAASLSLIAYHSFSVVATGNAIVQKSGAAIVTGTPTIVSDGRLGVPTTANGGRYATAPAVGVTLPNGINLAHLPGFSGGSGYTATPTVTVVGGTAVGTAGTATAVLAGGRVIGLTISGTWSSPPTGVTFSGGTPTVAASTNATWTTELANRAARFTSTLNATTGQINGFTIVNAGSDYVSATIALGTAAAGEVAATTPTVKAALYNLSLANFANTAPPTPADWTTPATQASVPHDEATNLAGLVPSGRKWNNITLGGGLGQVSFTGNVTLFGTAPLTLGGGPINMGGNALLFQNSGYLGTNSSSLSWVYNGTIQLNYIGTAATPGTRAFPFRATGGTGAFRILCGTGTAPAGGSNITQIKVEQVGAPSGAVSGTPAAGNMTGTRSFKVDILNGAAFGATTPPTVDLAWDASDNLVSNNQSLYLCQSNTGLSSGWNVRTATATTGNLTATGVRASATVAPGPIAFANTMYFGFSTNFTAPAGLNYAVSRTTSNTYNSIASIAQGGDGTGLLVPGITQTSNNDDVLSSAISLTGTTFQYQGAAVTGLKVSTNSWLTFNTAETASSFTNGFASVTAPRSVIAPYWDDTYHYGAYSNLYYKIDGTLGSGTAKIIVEWYKYSYFSASGPELYYQVVLDENGNKISINYGNTQSFNGTFNRRHTYSMGLMGSFVSPFPQAGEIMALQYENTTAFGQGGTLNSNLGANALCQNPTPRSSYLFTPGTYVAPSPFVPVVSAPVNDNVGGAVSVTPLLSFPTNIAWHPTDNRSNYYTLKGATQSPQPVCGGPANPKDVWFKFNANDPNIQVRIYPSAGMTPVIEVLDASLNPLAPVSCNVGTTEGAVSLTTTLTGLTVGDDYYVRVYNKFTGTTAQVTAILGGSSIAALTTVTGGTAYPAGVTSAPTTEVTLSGGGGVGGVVSASTTGGVLSFALTNGGLGYTSAPTITVNSPDIGLTGEFGIIVYAKPGNDECPDAFLLTNVSAPAKVGTLTISSASVTSGSSTMTVASTASLGTVGSVWVLSGPFVDPNTTGTVASATTITLSSVATGSGTFNYTARQNTYSAVTTGAATPSSSSSCFAFSANFDDDVFYKFVATAADHAVYVVGKGGFDPAIDVRTSCAAGAYICSNANVGANTSELLSLSGLTIGATYTVRVGHSGTGSPIGSSFEISVYSPLRLQYQFSQSNGSYSAITGGTVLGSGTIDNDVYKVIGGANKFRFNTVDFDSAFVSANGFVMLNERPDASTLYPLNVAGGGGALAAFAADLADAAGAAEIRYQYVSPEHVFQWSGMRRSGSTGEGINFQIRMNSSTGDVKYVYGSSTPGTSTAVTVCGIRNDQAANPAATSPLGGFKAINVMNRTTLGSPTSQNWSSTTTGTTLTSAVGTTASSFPVSGLTFTYSASSCNPYTLLSATIGTTDKTDPYTVNWRLVPGSLGYVLRYRKSTDDNTGYTSVNVGSVDTDTSYTFAANTLDGSTYYIWDILSVCGPSATEKSHASNAGIFNTKGDPIAYDYAVSAGTYTEITGGTVLKSGSIDDEWANHTPTSSFEINGAVFNDASVNSNGFLVGGTITLSAATYTPLASLLGLGLVSPFGEDLDGLATGEIMYEDVGAEHVWQWKDWGYYLATGLLNFQARYNKTSKVWKFVYGDMTFARNSDSAYVGIRAGANQGRRDILALTNRPVIGSAVDWTKLYTANRGTANSGGASWPNTTTAMPSGTTVTMTPITCGGITMAKMPVTAAANPGENLTVITKNAANDVKWYRAIASGGSSASSGYKIRYRDTDDPETVATWATPINTGSGPNDTTYSFTGLKPGATVLYQIAGRCDAANRTAFGGIGRFVTLPADNDIEFAAVVGPTGSSCFSSSTGVVVRVSNQGLLAVGAGEVFNYTINIAGPTAGTLTGSYTTTASLAPGATLDFSVGSANMAAAGNYTITGNIAWTSDEKTNNNDLGTPYVVTSYSIVTIPATYAVDSAVAGAGFSNVSGINQPSYRTTAMTNPTLAIQEGSGFVYWNAFNISSGNIGRFTTPCVNVPTNCYEMKFYHSRDDGYPGVASDEGTVVRVSTDGGLTWSVAKPIKNITTGKDTGYVRRYFAPATSGAIWQEYSLDLAEYNGQNIKVAFDMTSRFGNNFGIDNIRFTGKSITNDLSYESVVSPESFTSCGTAAVPVVVRVRNTGCQSYSNIGINLLVSGAGTANISNIIPGPLDGGQFVDFSVGTVNMINPGNYILDGNLVVSDQVAGNNNLPNTTVTLIAPPQLSLTIGNANALLPATTTLNGSFNIGAPVVAYTTSTNVAIGDGPSSPCGTAGADAVSNLVVGAPGTLASAIQKVTVNINHNFCEDLRIRLRAPDNSTIELFPSCTGVGANFTGTNFVASGGSAISGGTGPYAGDWTPSGSFSGLSGSANGQWKLIVTDHYSIGTGTILNWSITLSNGIVAASWTCPTCPTQFPVNFTDPVTSVAFPNNPLGAGYSAGSYDITLAATDRLGCANQRDTTFNLFSTNIWLGINDGANNWNDAANWIATPAPPTPTQEITIPAGTPFPPKANAAVTVGTVNQSAGSVINIDAGGQLNIAANWNGNGGSTAGAGTVNFNSSGAQAINGVTDFNNLTITKSTGTVNVAGTARINGALTLANGTSGITVPSTGNLVIASTASGTGRIAAVPSGATINGNVTMERYLPWTSGGSDGQWFFLSSPIVNKNFADFADDFKVYGPSSAYGSQGGGIISIGAQHSTILGYAESLNSDSANFAEKNGWKAPSANIINGTGYRVYVDKYSNASHKVDNVGTVKTGIVNFPVLSRTVNAACTPSTFNCDLTRTGWNLLGNPYPSPIDWDAASGWTRPSNLQGGSPTTPTFWRYITDFSSYGFYTPGIGWLGAGPAPSNPSVIPSSQAFFVRLASGTSGSIVATENVKSGSANTFLRVSSSSINKLKLVLKKDNDNSTYQYSGAVRFMEEATDGYDPMLDISNLAASGYYFTFPVENAECGINSMGSLTEQKIVPINTRFAGQSGNYTFSFEDLSTFNAGVEIFLKDKYFNTIQSITGNPQVSFEVTSASMSMTDRFELIFNPIPFTSVKGLGNGQFFGIHPNPSNGDSRVVFSVSGVNDNEGVITVVDMVGKVVFTSRMDLLSSKLNEKEVNLGLPAGVYNVKFSSRHSSFMDKLVIR